MSYPQSDADSRAFIFVSSVLDNSFSASVGRSLQTLPGAGNRSIVPV